MVGLSVRFDGRFILRLLGVLSAGALVLAAVFVLPKRGDVAVNLSGSGAVVKNYTVAKNEQRLKFIAQFGWEVEEEPLEVEEVLVPEKFDDTYAGYNELQKAQELDLSRYAGKKVRRYCYRILNYPEREDEIVLNLLVSENKVIGGDVCSAAIDGFMHGFRYEAQ